MIDYMIGQDIHIWERKALINERFFKMQHLCRNVYMKIKKNRAEMREIHQRLSAKDEYNAKQASVEVRTTKEEILKTINRTLDEFNE